MIKFISPEKLARALKRVGQAITNKVATEANARASADTAHDKQIAVLSAEKSALELRVKRLEASAEGKLYIEEVDSTEAYSKTVPADAVPVAGLKSLGGKSVVWNNVFDSLLASAGGTMTNLVRTATTMRADAYPNSEYNHDFRISKNISGKDLLKPGHKYLFSAVISSGGDLTECCFAIYRVNGSGSSTTTSRDVSSETPARRTEILTCNLTEVGNEDLLAFSFFPAAVASGWAKIEHPLIADLTLAFGAGNEPTSVDDPRILALIDYSESHPEYSAGQIISADVNAIHSETIYKRYLSQAQKNWIELNVNKFDSNAILFYDESSVRLYKCDKTSVRYISSGGIVFIGYEGVNNTGAYLKSQNDIKISAGVPLIWNKTVWETQMKTFPAVSLIDERKDIPAAIRALPGYGLSAGTAKNYIDFERKVYVQEVGSVKVSDLKNLTLFETGETRTLFSAVVDEVFLYSSIDIPNLLLAGFVSVPYNQTLAADEIRVSPYNALIFINTGPGHNLQSFLETHGSGTLQFELAEPIETDISDLLSGFVPYIECESGGTITAEQSETKLPVPSEIVYSIKTGAENV